MIKIGSVQLLSRIYRLEFLSKMVNRFQLYHLHGRLLIRYRFACQMEFAGQFICGAPDKSAACTALTYSIQAVQALLASVLMPVLSTLEFH